MEAIAQRLPTMLGAAVLLAAATIFAQQADAPLLLYASFDEGVDADAARSDPRGLFNGPHYGLKWDKAVQSRAEALLKLAPGLKGNGLLAGLNGHVGVSDPERGRQGARD